MGKTAQGKWVDFGWQGVRLSVPEVWNLGKVEGSYKSGYARLDDEYIVRAEIEWREGRSGLSVDQLVGRYLENLEKKAGKSGLDFEVKRRARFLNDKRYLDGYQYETFIWEADYRAYNLARLCPDCGRIVLLRLLTRRDETLDPDTERVFASLSDHAEEGCHLWALYGLRFWAPEDLAMREHKLKSGHIELSFERGKEELRVHRLSMAQMLLRGTDLTEWYGRFFKKQLRDFKYESSPAAMGTMDGIAVEGRPRSRWRQILRPLPLINPRPRRYLEGRIWHSTTTNKICAVEHLFAKKGTGDGLAQRVADGYFELEEGSQAEPRGDAGLAADPQ